MIELQLALLQSALYALTGVMAGKVAIDIYRAETKSDRALGAASAFVLSITGMWELIHNWVR